MLVKIARETKESDRDRDREGRRLTLRMELGKGKEKGEKRTVDHLYSVTLSKRATPYKGMHSYALLHVGSVKRGRKACLPNTTAYSRVTESIMQLYSGIRYRHHLSKCVRFLPVPLLSRKISRSAAEQSFRKHKI